MTFHVAALVLFEDRATLHLVAEATDVGDAHRAAMSLWGSGSTAAPPPEHPTARAFDRLAVVPEAPGISFTGAGTASGGSATEWEAAHDFRIEGAADDADITVVLRDDHDPSERVEVVLRAPR